MLRYPAINIQPVGWSDGRPQSIHNFSLFCFDQNLSKLSPLFLKMILFFKWPNAGLFFVYFRSFQTNNTIFTTNKCAKMSCPFHIRCQDSNPWPLAYESSLITTRTGLPPCYSFVDTPISTERDDVISCLSNDVTKTICGAKIGIIKQCLKSSIT